MPWSGSPRKSRLTLACKPRHQRAPPSRRRGRHSRRTIESDPSRPVRRRDPRPRRVRDRDADPPVLCPGVRRQCDHPGLPAHGLCRRSVRLCAALGLALASDRAPPGDAADRRRNQPLASGAGAGGLARVALSRADPGRLLRRQRGRRLGVHRRRHRRGRAHPLDGNAGGQLRRGLRAGPGHRRGPRSLRGTSARPALPCGSRRATPEPTAKRRRSAAWPCCATP